MVTDRFFEFPVKRRSFLQLIGVGAAAVSLGTPFEGWSADEGFAAFMKASLFITGKTSLDSETGGRIYKALKASDKAFPNRLKALNKYISQSGANPETLQSGLEEKNKDLAKAARVLAKAWYLGVVGEGKNARAIIYENALMFDPVRDLVVIPSYATGAYGSWITPPASVITGGGR